MFSVAWLTSFRVAACSAEVKDQKADGDTAEDVNAVLDKSKIVPFDSPGQMSNISTAPPLSPPSELDLELGPDWDDWCSDCSDQRTESLTDTFPAISAFYERQDAKTSIKGWSAVGHKLAVSLASCEADSDEEDLPSPTTQAKASMQAWADVGQRFASALANCEEDADAECEIIKRTPKEDNIKSQMDAWSSVGNRLAGVLATAAQEEEFWETAHWSFGLAKDDLLSTCTEKHANKTSLCG